MTTPELEELVVADVAAWRDWLHRHHDTSPGVWLALTRHGGTATLLRHAEAVEEALCVGWTDGRSRRRDKETTLQRMAPMDASSSWSFRNVERAERLEREGRMQPAGLAAMEAARADGRWDAAYREEAAR